MKGLQKKIIPLSILIILIATLILWNPSPRPFKYNKNEKEILFENFNYENTSQLKENWEIEGIALKDKEINGESNYFSSISHQLNDLNLKNGTINTYLKFRAKKTYEGRIIIHLYAKDNKTKIENPSISVIISPANEVEKRNSAIYFDEGYQMPIKNMVFLDSAKLNLFEKYEKYEKFKIETKIEEDNLKLKLFYWNNYYWENIPPLNDKEKYFKIKIDKYLNNNTALKKIKIMMARNQSNIKIVSITQVIE